MLASGGLVLVCCGPSGTSQAPAGDGATASNPTEASLDATLVLRAIARDIQALRFRYPQLRKFAVRKHFDPARLTIEYGRHTHRSTRRGGWTAGVPNPDPKGVWLYLDFHDPSSTAQIHTQPVVRGRHFGTKNVMFLLLEGENTTSIAEAVDAILERHGVAPGRVPANDRLQR